MSAAHPESTTVTPFRRLRKTPLRDLLRGRITGRLSPEIQCRDAALPQPLLETVCVTARRTCLLRMERAEVAQELIAHFRDGLDAKRSVTDLVDAFGDTRTAARLVRRAKKRDRALTLKLAFGSLKALAAFILLVVLVYAVLAARYFTTKPGPIVEYAPRANAAALAVPPEDRAWPLYREILLTDGFRDKARELTRDARPGWRDWAKTEAFLREHTDTLDRMRAAAGKPGLGFIAVGPISPEDARLFPNLNQQPDSDTLSVSLLDTLLPYLGELHLLATLLSADAILAADQGDTPRAAANIQALLGVANHSRETPFLINDLVGIGLVSTAIRETLVILHHHPDLLTDAHLQRIAHALAAFPTNAEPLVRLYGDQMVFDDLVQRLYSLDSDGDGVLAPGAYRTIEALEGRAAAPAFAEHAAGPVFSAVAATRRETLDFYREKSDAAIAWISEPAWTRAPYAEPFDELDSALARTRYLLPAIMMPAYASALLQGERFQTTRDAALCAIAIERFRRNQGELPKTLADLTPHYLPRAPFDPFTGEPLRYRTSTDDGYILYSVGNNYTDDAGTIPQGADPAEFANTAGRWIAREDAQALLESPDHISPDYIVKYSRWGPREQVARGDWILYPPPLPKEPPPREEFPM